MGLKDVFGSFRKSMMGVNQNDDYDDDDYEYTDEYEDDDDEEEPIERIGVRDYKKSYDEPLGRNYGRTKEPTSDYATRYTKEPEARAPYSSTTDSSSYGRFRKPGSTESPTNVLNLPSSDYSQDSKAKVAVFKPKIIEEATSVCQEFKRNSICIVNLEGVEHSNAQRIADFLGGASFALSGDMQRISNDIFLIAPSGIPINFLELREEINKSETGTAPGPAFPWTNIY